MTDLAHEHGGDGGNVVESAKPLLPFTDHLGTVGKQMLLNLHNPTRISQF